MNQERRIITISRRSVIGLLGLGGAGRALAQLPFLPGRGMLAQKRLPKATNDGSAAFVANSKQVTYASGGMSYIERLDNGHWVGQRLGGRGSNPNSNFHVEDAFTVVIKDKPTPASQRGTELASGWRLVSASEIPSADRRFKHAVVHLSNAELPISLEVHTLLDGTPVFKRWLTLMNHSPRALALTELSPWSGRLWAGREAISIGESTRREYEWEAWFGWKPLNAGSNSVSEEKGLSWDDPYFVLRNDTRGEYAFGQLAWPVNYSMQFIKEDGIAFRASPTATEALRVMAPQETITTPALHMGCISGSFDDAVHAMHDHIRRSVSPKPPAARAHRCQYIIPEDWWMTVYRGREYNEANMKKCIDVAHAVGLEVFILDGPMWCSAYGDWSVPNKERFPNGLVPLADHARSKGLLFALYSETEGGRDGYCSKPNGACIGKWAESKVFEEHPNWFTQPRSVLNLSIPEAAVYMRSAVTEIIENYKLDLFRHDFNAPERGQGSQTERHGFIENDYWRHYEALYKLFDEVRQKHPDVIFQQAAAGGARSELATVGVFHEQFTSDRAAMPFVYRMLSGFSVFLPPEILVNAAGLAPPKDLPDLDTTLRGAFALANTPMIFNSILPKTVEEIPSQMRDKYLHYTNLYKSFMRPLLDTCKVYHHDPVNGTQGVESGSWFAMEFGTPDRQKSWAVIIQLKKAAGSTYRFKPRSLDRETRYRVTLDNTGQKHIDKGADLTRYGIVVQIPSGGASELLLFETV